MGNSEGRVSLERNASKLFCYDERKHILILHKKKKKKGIHLSTFHRSLFRATQHSCPIQGPPIYQSNRTLCVNLGEECSELSPDRNSHTKNSFALGRAQIGTCHTVTGNVWFQLEGSVAGRKHLKLKWEVKECSSNPTQFYETKWRS
jgi:hypothetical protein